ncbi:MAG: anaerobic ribonucleoside-triphosphate reductase activating protein [Oscillospiraceae bacterium]|jgi:anaerobic ribonucleoside-triphosphate reductase activating protein|nr:anaerobic ribonucleoside-triphosphate reductase activating protein [Oscillospiraceae bacterium]
MKIQLADIIQETVVDGPGLRFSVYVQGCPHGCKGCHNPHTHDFEGGYTADTDDILEQILENPLLDGVTFSGGEPFCQTPALAELARKIKTLTDLNIVVYTGFTFEYLKERPEYAPLLDAADYLIDGRFEQDLKDYSLKFRGSSNQRFLPVK